MTKEQELTHKVTNNILSGLACCLGIFGPLSDFFLWLSILGLFLSYEAILDYEKGLS
jgi:hypothetical protein